MQCYLTPCWAELAAFLKQAQLHFAMAALETLLNSWCTHARYHDEGPNVCIFGCADAKVDLTHYASCAPLWQVSYDVAQTSLASFAEEEEQLLLLVPTRQRLNVTVIAFSVYHGVKRRNPAAAAKA